MDIIQAYYPGAPQPDLGINASSMLCSDV
jgi:hypothetical protein